MRLASASGFCQLCAPHAGRRRQRRSLPRVYLLAFFFARNISLLLFALRLSAELRATARRLRAPTPVYTGGALSGVAHSASQICAEFRQELARREYEMRNIHA